MNVHIYKYNFSNTRESLIKPVLRWQRNGDEISMLSKFSVENKFTSI